MVSEYGTDHLKRGGGGKIKNVRQGKAKHREEKK